MRSERQLSRYWTFKIKGVKLKGSVTNENDYQLSPTPFFFLVCPGFREAGFAGKVLILWV